LDYRYVESQRIVETMVPVEKLVPVQTIVTRDVPVLVEKCVKQDVPFDVEKVYAACRQLKRLHAVSLRNPQIVIQEVSVPTNVEKVCLSCARRTHSSHPTKLPQRSSKPSVPPPPLCRKNLRSAIVGGCTYVAILRMVSSWHCRRVGIRGR
jgi:hypothetical protein